MSRLLDYFFRQLIGEFAYAHPNSLQTERISYADFFSDAIAHNKA